MDFQSRNTSSGGSAQAGSGLPVSDGPRPATPQQPQTTPAVGGMPGYIVQPLSGQNQAPPTSPGATGTIESRFVAPQPQIVPQPSLPPAAPQAPAPGPTPAPKKPEPKKRFAGSFVRNVIIVTVVVALLLGGLLVLWQQRRNNAVKSEKTTDIEALYDTLSLPLSELVKQGGITLGTGQTLRINGQLTVNNSLVMSPGGRPSNAVAGQMYYDQQTNQLAYYNGSDFVSVLDSGAAVANIGGLTGTVAVGGGLTATGGQITNSGVLSIQGNTGDVNFTSGGGIAVDGTTLSNTGVLSLGGATGDIAVGNGLSVVNGTLSSTGVTSVASGSASLLVTTDANGNVTITNNGAGTGTVDSPGGTAGRIAKFTGVQTIEDSLLSEAGTTVTVNGDLAITGSLTLGTLLSVSNGGTGAASFTNNGVLIGQGTAAITAVSAGGSGLCLMSTAGAPSFQACPGGSGGVTSLNGLTGALTVANASAAGSTITINDASTSQKGIAQFNATNFSAASGIINTIQDIHTTATPTFGQLTLTSSQASGVMLTVNNTNASATGNLVDLRLNGSSRFAVAPSGALTLSGTINGQTISSTANFTGTLAVAGAASLNGGATVGGTLTANTITPSSSLTVGATNQSFTLQGNSSSTITATSGASTTTVAFQAPTANVTYRFLTAAAGTYDICTTAGNCAGVGGGVTTPGGTVGTLARFTGTQTIGDSIITDNGTVVTIGGTLAVNTISPTAAFTLGATTQNLTMQGAAVSLAATSGGITNTLTFATPAGSNKTITVPNATGTLAVSASGPLAIDANGNISCPTCVTSGGGGGGQAAVDSLNGLTGALTIANATAAGSTITIDDASTTQKGIAQFNATNFSASGGVINTIQNIAITSSPTFAAINTNAITPSSAMTIGATGQSFTLQGSASSSITATNGANTTTVSFQSPTASVTYRFMTAAAGTYDICTSVGNCAGAGGGVTTSGGTTNRLAKFTGSQTIGDSLISDDGATVAVNGGDLAVYNSGNNARIILGDSGTSGQYGYLQWDSTNDYFRIEKNGTNGMKINDNFVTIGNIYPDQPLQVANGTDLLFKVDTTGRITTRTTTDSVNGFQVQDNAGGSVLNVDTLNNRVGINGISTPAVSLDVAGAIQQTGLETLNTLATDENKWIKLGTCTLDTQYEQCLTTLNIIGGQDGTAGDFPRATVSARVKQQDPLASAPIVDLQLNGTAAVITKDDIKTVTVQNDATATVVELYGRITNEFEQWYYTPVMNTGGFGVATWVWSPEDPFQAALPAGTQTAATYSTMYATTLQATTAVMTPSLRPIADGLSAFKLQSTDATVTALVADTYNGRIAIGGDFGPTEQLDVMGAFQVRDAATPTKQLRVRTNGGGLDMEAAGANLVLSTWSGAGYTGTQYNQITFKNDGSNMDFARGFNVASGQNVGLGGNVNPQYPLDVTGDINTSTQYRIGGTVICTATGCTPAAGSANYIQNQNASSQTANFRISGTGRADTSLQAPLIDTPTATALDIGTTNATAINLNKSTVITGGITQSGGAITMTGNAASSIITTSNNALSIRAGGTAILTLNTSGAGTVNVGTDNTTTVNIGGGTDVARTIRVGDPQSAGTAAQTVSVGSQRTTSTTTIQGGTGTSAIALNTATNGEIAISSQGTGGINASIGSNGFVLQTTTDSNTALQVLDSSSLQIFNVNTSTGTILLGATQVEYSGFDGIITAPLGDLTVGQASSTLNLTGSIVASSINSTSAFQIQNASASAIFNVDTTNKVFNFGSTVSTTNHATFDISGTDSVLDLGDSTNGHIYLGQYASGLAELATDDDLHIIRSTNSTSAFQILNASNAALFTADTVAGEFQIVGDGTAQGGGRLHFGDWGNVYIGEDGVTDTDQMLLYAGAGLTLQNFNGTPLTISSSGVTTFKTSTNSATAFRVQNSSSTSVFNVDTSAGNVTINASATTYTERLCHNQTNGATTNLTLGDCQSTGQADLAEMYDTDGTVEPGDIVAPTVGRYKVTETKSPYQQSMIGIVSTNPIADGIIGYNVKSESRQPVALAGRVPLKVSLENGPIAVGDPLTSSSVPGVAMKATGPGPIIGTALEAYDENSARVSDQVKAEEEDRAKVHAKDLPSYRSNPDDWPAQVGKIMAFAKNSYVSDADQMQGTKSYESMQVQGELAAGTLNVSGKITSQDLVVTGKAVINELAVQKLTVAKDIAINGHIVSGGDTPKVETAATCSVTANIEGTDTAGLVTVETPEDCNAGGEAVIVKFAKAFESAPRITLTAANGDTSKLEGFVGSDTVTKDEFRISAGQALEGKKTYKWYYQVIQ